MTKPMTSRERVSTILAGGIPDRVGFHATIYFDHACVATGRRFEDFLLDPLVGNVAMLDAAVLYGTDTVRFGMVPDAEWFASKEVRQEGAQIVQYDRRTGRREGTYDVSGGGHFQPDVAPAVVRSLADVEQIPVPSADDYAQRGQMRGVVEAVEKAHQRDLFVVGLCGAQSINSMVQHLGGAEKALLCFYDDPDLARALIDKAVAISLEKSRAWVAAGVDVIYIGDSYASASVISPAIYTEFCAPAYRRLADAIHQLGCLTYKHCCGFYDPLLPHLAETHIDAMDGIDPTTGMTVERTKKAVGNVLTLIGGLSCLTLLQGTPERVYEESRQCIEAGKAGGRFILGSACAVPRATPKANLLAAGQAVRDFGDY